MKEFYSKYYGDELWRIKENEFIDNLQNVRESQFALGNGLIGSRGVLEEKPGGSQPGTYVAGLYDSLTAQVAEMVNLPNPFYFKFMVFGQKIGVTSMDIVSHQRILNTRNATLSRHTVYTDNQRNRYDYQSIRFLSMKNKNIGAMQITFTSLDTDLELELQTGIDTSVHNSGVVTEGDKRHFSTRELARDDNAELLVVRTLESPSHILYRNGFHYKLGTRRRVYAKENVLRLKLKKNQRATFTKVFYISPILAAEDLKKHKKTSGAVFEKALRSNFKNLLEEHVETWSGLWEKADIRIEGTADIQKNVRFNIYHMLVCAHYDDGVSSIGARTLSGEGYRGHVFWDTEIFLLPFYAFQLPRAAKNILLYRYRRLDQARAIAREQGFDGALFPWESAGKGAEETPTWAKNLDGSIIKIKTNAFEQHIVADVAYACYKYFQITADQEFMEEYGYELIFECARFWASRVKGDGKGRFGIYGIMGPDEFHETVDNNAYTNLMAKWNLELAGELYRKVKKKKRLHGRLRTALKLTDKEVIRWNKVAEGLVVRMRRNKVIEQFDGFLTKQHIELVNFDENNIPLLPEGVKVKDYNKTQFVKQADVVMALYLLEDRFERDVKESNFWFYLHRTLHKSSLSAPVHAVMAAKIGALSRAYQFFHVALRADISDLHGNTREGIHAASLGGVWQCLVHGFAGVGIHRNTLSVFPYMPLTWHSMKFGLTFRETDWKFEVDNEQVRVKARSGTKKRTKIMVFDRMHLIDTGRWYVFKAGKSVRKIPLSERYY